VSVVRGTVASGTVVVDHLIYAVCRVESFDAGLTAPAERSMMVARARGTPH